MSAVERRKQQARRKHRLHPDQYHSGPVGLAEAYTELSKSAFSVWIRLNSMTQKELRSGKSVLCKILGYKSERGISVLEELERSGYIGFVVTEYRKARAVVILRRAKIRFRGSYFVRTG